MLDLQEKDEKFLQSREAISITCRACPSGRSRSKEWSSYGQLGRVLWHLVASNDKVVY